MSRDRPQAKPNTAAFLPFLRIDELTSVLKTFNFSCFVLTRVCTVYGWLITGLLNFGHFLSQLCDSFKNHLIIHTLIDFLSLINLQKDCTFLSLTNYLVFITTHKKFYEWNYVRWTNFSNNFFLTFLNADSQFLSQ